MRHKTENLDIQEAYDFVICQRTKKERTKPKSAPGNTSILSLISYILALNTLLRIALIGGTPGNSLAPDNLSKIIKTFRYLVNIVQKC